MSNSFSFDDGTLGTDSYLTQGQLTRSSSTAPAVAVSTGQTISSSGDVDIIAVTLVAGRSYQFDIDQGFGDSSGGSVDLQLSLINARGNLVERDSGSTSTDPGSVSTRDPLVSVSVNVTGTYYLAVSSETVDYVNGQSRFTGSGGTGDYTLAVSTSSIPTTKNLTNDRNSQTFSDASQNIQALGGNDSLTLSGGNDIATGGSGNDSLYGGSGADELTGGTGFDGLYGGANGDVLIGGTDADQLYGGTTGDALNGGSGNDALFAEDGNDTLLGNSGNDNLFGGAGNDLLRGGAGVDSLTGGSGADTFHFLPGEAPYDTDPSNGIAQDRVLDFNSNDAIDLSDLSAGTLAFRGSNAAFTGANQVRVLDLRNAEDAGFQEVQVNLDADTAPEFSILVDYAGATNLGASDFVL